MKAISLIQPWAQLVVLGTKRAETRSWPTTYRGEIAIHASKGFPGYAKTLCKKLAFKRALDEYNFVAPTLPLGAIVGTVEITGCYRTEEAGSMGLYDHSPEDQFGDYSPGRYFWILENPLLFATPIPCKGALKIWTIPSTYRIINGQMVRDPYEPIDA